MNWKEKLFELIATKISDKVDGVNLELSADKVVVRIINGEVTVEAENLKTNVNLSDQSSAWERQKEVERLRNA